MHKLAKVKVGGKNPVRIMGILNSSPESFYKNSIKTTKQSIRDTIKQMEVDGVDFIDIGGMSTAPYLSTIVSEKIELDRITNAIKIVQNSSNLPISIDTCRARVAETCLELGVEIINDISGLKFDNKMANSIKKFNPSLILCAYSSQPVKGDHVTITRNLLQKSIKIAKNAGFSSNNIVLDPAIGFFRKSGKNPFFTKIQGNWVERDLAILHNLQNLKQKFPILVSVSNKSFIGELLKKENPQDRLVGTIAAEIISIINGADIVRTHNVRATKDALLLTSEMIHRNKGL